MHCDSCGDLMCTETVIRLRRTVFGLREQRLQGAYCAWCKISSLIEDAEPKRTVHVSTPRRGILAEGSHTTLSMRDAAA